MNLALKNSGKLKLRKNHTFCLNQMVFRPNFTGQNINIDRVKSFFMLKN